MPKITRHGSTMRQKAYAMGVLGAKGKTKKEVALRAGYSRYSANSVASHIEAKPGFHNAMSALALESNNLALSAMHEFKARGFKDFTNRDLVGALNAIGSAWSRFNAQPKEKEVDPTKNRLRTIILQQVENQTIGAPVPEPEPQSIIDITPIIPKEVGEGEMLLAPDDMDF